jgi:hypothetical protein
VAEGESGEARVGVTYGPAHSSGDDGTPKRDSALQGYGWGSVGIGVGCLDIGVVQSRGVPLPDDPQPSAAGPLLPHRFGVGAPCGWYWDSVAVLRSIPVSVPDSSPGGVAPAQEGSPLPALPRSAAVRSSTRQGLGAGLSEGLQQPSPAVFPCRPCVYFRVVRAGKRMAACR